MTPEGEVVTEKVAIPHLGGYDTCAGINGAINGRAPVFFRKCADGKIRNVKQIVPHQRLAGNIVITYEDNHVEVRSWNVTFGMRLGRTIDEYNRGRRLAIDEFDTLFSVPSFKRGV